MTIAPSFEVFCAEVLGEPISPAWVIYYKCVEGLPLGLDEEAIYTLCTGRDSYVPRVYPESTGICGRRSEKTSTAIKFLLWKAVYAGWEKQLRKSWFGRLGRHTELLRIPLIAQDLRVAGDIQRTAEALILNSMLEREIAEIFKHEIIFKNGVSFICLPASKASVRGLTVPGALLDEIAWTVIENASDVELVRQVRPAMLQFGASRRLLKLSTPWQKSGIIYDEFASRAERPDLLVWQASTETMTPRIDRDELARERAADESYYLREYGAEFTDDLESFIPANDIQVAANSWTELAPDNHSFYLAALDASGLTGGDRFVFGICHSHASGVAVDVLRGWKRAPAAEVIDEIANLCDAFRVRNIIADQFSFTFVSELLRQKDIGLDQLAFTARSKPELFFDLKNLLAAGTLQLPNHPEMIRELRALESVRTSVGNYRISAPRNQHDDFATVLALLANKVKRSRPKEPFHIATFHIPRSAGPPPRPVSQSQFNNLGPTDFGPEKWWRHQ